jgi:hypothetical protein
MSEGPARAAYPNGQFPAINDSDPASIDVFRWAFDWAAKVYNEPEFASTTGVVPTKSDVLEESGLAILRQGEGKDAVCVMMDFGPHGGGHGHFDKLGIMLFANGREWLLDPGRLTYSHKEYKTWVKETAAHNTVTLGGKSQRATTGKLLWLKEGKHGDVPWSACAAESGGAYEGAVLRRYVLLTPSVLVDVFEVEQRGPVRADWMIHALADSLQAPVGMQPRPLGETLGAEAGYQHLTQPLQFPAHAGPWTFVAGNQKLSVWLPADPHDGIGQQTEAVMITTRGIGYNTSQMTPTLIQRREHGGAFTAVYDLSGKGAQVLEARPFGGESMVLGVSVRTAEGHWDIDFSTQGLRMITRSSR